MQQCCWFLSMILLARAASQLDQHWHSWKKTHGKVYMDIPEEKIRRSIWLHNLGFIQDFNNRTTSNFTLSINQFADLVSQIECFFTIIHHQILHQEKHLFSCQTNEEYQKYFLSPLIVDDEGNYTGAAIHLPPPVDQTTDYPERVDWRQKGFVTPVIHLGIKY